MFIETKADIHVQTPDKRTAFQFLMLKECDSKEIMQYFIDHDYLTFNNKEIISLFLKQDIDVIMKLVEFHKNNTNVMLQILPKFAKEFQNEWFDYISNNNKINKSIIKHRNYIYEKPNHIISMCAEVLFNKKQGKYIVPDKLQVLFDTKDDKDCLNKINCYV